MGAVREFHRDDIQQVASLWLKVFRRSGGRPARALQDYFRDIFFDSPWADAGLPSLVYEDGGRGIVGFLGLLPRRMLYRGRPVRVAVATQLMVADDARGYPAVKLMRHFLAGDQDLSYSDGANDFSERLWRACGGDVALPYSLTWTRILRPLQHARAVLTERGGWAIGLAAQALRPVAHSLDALAAQTGPGARWLPQRPDAAIEEPTEDALLWCIQHLCGARDLAPAYDIDTLRWLLRRAAEKKKFGALRTGLVRERNGDVAGWYLYYLKRGAAAQVLQFGARPRAARKVLNSLFYRARGEGAVAVTGGLEPRFVKELAAERCEFAWPGYAVVIHSRHRDILDAVRREDAFLSRLEGEWWARFSDPQWTPEEPGAELPLAATLPGARPPVEYPSAR